jgi:hypothetical protein
MRTAWMMLVAGTLSCAAVGATNVAVAGPEPVGADEIKAFKKSQEAVKKCVAESQPNAIIVFTCGFNLSSTGQVVGGRPDLWTVNDDCTVKDQPRLLYANPMKLGAYKRMAETVERLTKEDRTRPVILIGHSMGGAALEDMTNALWDRSLRADLLIAIDAVAAKSAIPDKEEGADATKHMGGKPEIKLSGAPYAVVHILADGKGPETSGDWMQRVTVPKATQYQVKGTNHTTVDGAPETLVLVKYLCSLVPAKGINTVPNSTSADYKAVTPPTELNKFPEEVRKQLEGRITVLK